MFEGENMKYLPIIIAMLILLQGCAIGGKIQETTSIQQEVGINFDVGVGGEVYTSNREKNLPNAFGRADIFGRMTPSGKTSVVFAGIENGTVVLFRRSIDIHSGATTMNSTPLVVPSTYTSTHSGYIGGSYYSGVTTTQAPPIVIPPNSPVAQYFDKGSIPIIIPLKDLPVSIPIESSEVNILDASSYKITVKISKK